MMRLMFLALAVAQAGAASCPAGPFQLHDFAYNASAPAALAGAAGAGVGGGGWSTRIATNRELYTASDPHHADLPYVYEHFEWAHCDALGYRL